MIGIEHAQRVQVKSETHVHDQEPQQKPKVAGYPGIDPDLTLGQQDTAAQEVENPRHKDSQDQAEINDLLEGVEKGILKEIKTDVLSEDRVVDATFRGLEQQESYHREAPHFAYISSQQNRSGPWAISRTFLRRREGAGGACRDWYELGGGIGPAGG